MRNVNQNPQIINLTFCSLPLAAQPTLSLAGHYAQPRERDEKINRAGGYRLNIYQAPLLALHVIQPASPAAYY